MGDVAHDVPDAVRHALAIARELIRAGIPVFAAPPCPSGPLGPLSQFQEPGVERPACTRPGHAGGAVEYDLPPKWQMTVPSEVWLDEKWRPGWALAAVGGHAADFLDEDPRNGGDASVGQLHAEGAWPRTFGMAGTKSGGRHYITSPLGERKATGFLPGLDYQGGVADGQGRGFIWIAPTVGRSKETGELAAYSWIEEPNLEFLAEFDGGGDDSIEGIRDRLLAARARRVETARGVQALAGAPAREFTREQMRQYCDGPLRRLQLAEIGVIEERANDLACALSHFVPSMLSEEQAFDVLAAALGETAYDPNHPASTWDAEKFRAVVASERGRAPGDWYAVEVADGGQGLDAAVAAVDVQGDEVSALLAEMVTMDELAARKPPRYMVKGLLSYDSEAWLIGGPGSKKSFVALDLAGHVATGREWQGMKVNPGAVVFVVAEGAGSIGKRVAAWKKQYGDIPADRMRALPRPVQAAELKSWAVLVAACRRLREALDPDLGMLIVLDTQARVTVGLDENKADEMGVFIQAVAALRAATGACVVSVHHTVKAGDSTRGSSALDGAQDTRLLMKSERGSLAARLVMDKQKDLEQLADIELRFKKVDVGLDADGEPMDSLVLMPADEWRRGEVDDETLDGQGQAVVPFAKRAVPEHWTGLFTHPNAKLQRWVLQALADTASDRGLTQAEWRGLIDEKLGKAKPDHTAWRKAFQAVVDSGGQAMQSGAVIKVHGADRWTVDPVVIKGLSE